MFGRFGLIEMFIGMAIWLLPLLIIAYLLTLVVRAVKALESIADSLRSRR